MLTSFNLANGPRTRRRVSIGSVQIRMLATCSAAPSTGPGRSLTVGFSAIAFGLLVGGTLGLLAGYFRGKIDQIISFGFLSLLSFPALILAILITSLLERSLLTIRDNNRHPVGGAGRPSIAGNHDLICGS